MKLVQLSSSIFQLEHHCMNDVELRRWHSWSTSLYHVLLEIKSIRLVGFRLHASINYYLSIKSALVTSTTLNLLDIKGGKKS